MRRKGERLPSAPRKSNDSNLAICIGQLLAEIDCRIQILKYNIGIEVLDGADPVALAWEVIEATSVRPVAAEKIGRL